MRSGLDTGTQAIGRCADVQLHPSTLRVLAPLLGIAACGDNLQGPPVVLEAGDLAVSIQPADGTFDVERGGVVVLRRATADALIDRGDGPELVTLADGRCDAALDGGVLRCVAGDLVLRLAFEVGSPSHLIVTLELENTGTEPIQILRLSPAVADAERGGALVLGDDPTQHRILENGRFIAFDQAAQLVRADAPRFPIGEVLPIPLRGDSVSNWSHVIADVRPDGSVGASLVAGFLTFERAIPTLGVAAGSTSKPFAMWAAESALVWAGKPLEPGARLASETLWLEPLPGDPLAALERWADAIAEHQQIVPWAKRGPGHDLPNGWNSWSGGSGTGGYGQAIDEATITANLDIFRRELGAFGERWFQIDDGWQLKTGDWSWRTDAFPSGEAGMIAAIEAAGMRPGLWIAPFLAERGSQLAAAHPSWLMPPAEGAIGAFGKPGEVLDLSSAEVRGFLASTFTHLREAGWKFLKVDFAYWALLGTPVADPTLTSVEAFRLGWRTIRDSVGPDVFVLGVGVVGATLGIVDGMRLTLDDGPRWDETDPDDVLASPRSMKATVRTGSRRWFFQNRVFVSHNDLVFFRSWPAGGGDSAPPLSFTEARAFATWIGISGGIVDLGDRLVDLPARPGALDVIRRLLPAWPASARPLDVLVRDYPEVHRLPIDAPAGRWEIWALFHWGTNRDHTTTPPTEMSGTAPRTHELVCPDRRPCLAYELWTQRFLGAFDATGSIEVPARDAAVVALRPRTGAPQLLGTNRHITQGATDLGPISWDPTSQVLTGTLRDAARGTSAAPFAYELAFFIPDGWTATTIDVDGAEGLVTTVSAAPQAGGAVLRIQFTVATARVGSTLAFQIRHATAAR